MIAGNKNKGIEKHPIHLLMMNNNFLINLILKYKQTWGGSKENKGMMGVRDGAFAIIPEIRFIFNL